MAVATIGGDLTGTIAAFDDHTGLGQVATADGNMVPFHCTQIADGSRTIAIGTAVRFVVGAGGPGRWEAFDVRPC